MTTIESDITELPAGIETVKDFLSDVRGFEDLMPDQVVDWKADQNSCKFTIKGTADLGFRKQENVGNNEISYFSTPPSPFGFTLKALLFPINKQSTNIIFLLDAELNAFLQMVAGRPLKNLLNHMAARLREMPAMKTR